MFKTINHLSNSLFYWVFVLILGVLLEITALIYQYILDYYPCVLCIHVRIIIFATILLSLVAIKFNHCKKLLASLHLGLSLLFIFFAERSYNLLGVERGFVSGGCSMNSGLPSWFAIDQWFPWMFKIWEPCGYTPELILGITMAEALLVLSVLLSLVSLSITFAAIKNITKQPI